MYAQAGIRHIYIEIAWQWEIKWILNGGLLIKVTEYMIVEIHIYSAVVRIDLSKLFLRSFIFIPSIYHGISNNMVLLNIFWPTTHNYYAFINPGHTYNRCFTKRCRHMYFAYYLFTLITLLSTSKTYSSVFTVYMYHAFVGIFRPASVLTIIATDIPSVCLSRTYKDLLPYL